MTKGVFLALSNCVGDDVDDEFNQWYDEVHARQVLGIPGVKSFRRFHLAPSQVMPLDDASSRRYLAVYEVETDDWDAFSNEFMSRFGDGRITVNPELIQLDPMVLTMSFEEITPETTA
jgi:hypothetical protein